MAHLFPNHRKLLWPTPNWALGTIAFAHVIFALAFLLILALATVDARAEDPACGGVNILDDMTRVTPEKLAEIRRDAEKTPNGNGLLWRIEADGVEPSWLYGTMHLSDPRVLEMNAPARAAFENADAVVLELKEIQNAQKLQAAMVANPTLTMLEPGESLSTLLSSKDYETIKGILEERGIPPMLVSRMKPWLIFATIALPECEMSRRAQGKHALDMQLALDAAADGKRLEGLETVEEQVSALANLPLDLQIKMLQDVAALDVSQNDRIETMTALYLAGEISAIMPTMIHTSEVVGVKEDGAFNEFERGLIVDRNHTMAERLQQILTDGNAFVAVGALHLPGEEGLVELLRNQGYRVTAVQ